LLLTAYELSITILAYTIKKNQSKFDRTYIASSMIKTAQLGWSCYCLCCNLTD